MSNGQKHRYDGVSRTQQHQVEGTDINKMAGKAFQHRARKGNPDGRSPLFLDLSSSASFHDMQNRVLEIKDLFGQQPARLRTRFQNNPYLLMKWLENPVNAKEAVKLGLLLDPENILSPDPVVDLPPGEDLPNMDQTSILDYDGSQEPQGAESAPRADEEAQPRRTAQAASRTPQKGGKRTR